MDPDDFWPAFPGNELERLLSETADVRRRVDRKIADGDLVFTVDHLGRQVVSEVGDKPRRRRPSVSTSTEVARPMSALEAKEAQLKAMLMEFAGVVALRDRFKGQQPPVGSVLRWVKEYDGKRAEMVLDTETLKNRELRFTVQAPQTYVYLAFRAPDGKWYTTSQRGPATREWDDLLTEIGDSVCELSDSWIEVPAPTKVSEEAVDPSAWARQMFGQKSDETETTTESAS